MTDEEMLSEVRDIRRRMAEDAARLAAIDEHLCRDIAMCEARFRKIMNAVMENDEHQANMGRGLPCPNDYPIPPSDGHPPTPAHICVEDDWQ